ncbi:nuclear transport factor 2 family protein [Mycolicibacterium sp. P9-64]|uniref:nuclear transport factor 2 family protein n=1 Tax=Mycolicibacterium sp. P9-64 TaxID=2024612 RepID=UPI0011F0151F|nr:nuclear transport factor 2 family protein [Mycolicibacterium sp. P9-64]KAA0084574.1 nuclear transport factor 2 family protein [Mycolicibacterium sp. P9-64]
MVLISDAAVVDLPSVEELCAQWKAAWNDHDGDAVASLCAENLVYDEPALGDTVHGRDPIRNYVKAMHRAFPDYAFTLEGLYADLHRRAVLVAWRLTGTHAKSGHRIDFHGDDRLEFDESGLISAYRCLYDHALVLRQLKHPSSQ